MAFHADMEGTDEDEPGTARIRTEIRVMADRDRVWDVLTDLDAYPKWNPFIVEADGRLVEDARIEIALRTPGGRTMSFVPRVVEVRPPAKLRWRGRWLHAALFEGDHVFELERRGMEQTKVVHRETFSGLYVRWFRRRGLDDTRLGFEAMNRALKERAEADGD